MASRVDLIMKQFDKDLAEDTYQEQMKSEKDPFNRAMWDLAAGFEGARAGWEVGQIGVDIATGVGQLKEGRTQRKSDKIAKKFEKGKLPKALKRIDRAVARGANPDDLVELLTKSVTSYQINSNGETVQVVGKQPVTPKLQNIVQNSYVTYEQEDASKLVGIAKSKPGTTDDDVLVDNKDYNPLFDPKYYAKQDDAKSDEPRTEQEKLSDVKPDDDSKFKIWGSKRF